MLDKIGNLKKILRKEHKLHFFGIAFGSKSSCEFLKSTQIVMKIFIKNDCSIVYVTNFFVSSQQ